MLSDVTQSRASSTERQGKKNRTVIIKSLSPKCGGRMAPMPTIFLVK